jgi:hypothetical protein
LIAAKKIKKALIFTVYLLQEHGSYRIVTQSDHGRGVCCARIAANTKRNRGCAPNPEARQE